MPDRQPSLFDHLHTDLTLGAGLIAHLRFNGNVTDSQGTNDGTVSGTTTYSTGKVGNAFSFNGSTEVVLANETNFDFDVDDPWTIAFWIKIGSGADGMIFSKGGRYGWAAKGMGLQWSTGYNQLLFVSSTSTTGSNYLLVKLTGGTTVADNNWHHIVVTYDGAVSGGIPQVSSLKAYLDGVYKAPNIIATNTSTATDWLNNDGATIGNTSGSLSNTWLTGELDDYRIYNRVLTSTEASSLYNSGDGTEVAVARQRFVETFSGDALDTDRWATTGTGTFGMNDSVDGGFNVATLSTTNNDNYISFGGIGQYEETGSVIIWVSKVSHTTNISAQLGLRENGNGTQRSTCNVDATVVAGNFYLACVDGSGSTSTSSTVTSDTNWHVHKIENSSTNVKLTTDGVLKVTTTTNRPTVPLEPSMENFTYNTTIKNVSMKYCEAYNT